MATLQWFELRAPGHGTITIKARYQWEAVQEAAERWGCREEDVLVVAWGPYYARSNFA